MVVLAAACLGVGLGAPMILAALASAIVTATGLTPAEVTAPLAQAGGWLRPLTVAALILIVLALGLSWLRRRLLARTAGRCRGHLGLRLRPAHGAHAIHRLVVRPAVDGLVRAPAPDPRTSAGAGRSVSRKKPASLRIRRTCARKDFSSPLFRKVKSWLSRLRWLQQGKVQLYILYLALTLLVLLIWKL